MLGLSKKIIGSVVKYSDRDEDLKIKKDSITTADEENESIDVDKNGKEENSISIKDIDCPLPPGVWRKGIDCPKSKGIFLRFATRTDKKQVNAEKKSNYYKKYGNPNFGGKHNFKYSEIKSGFRIMGRSDKIIFYVNV